MSQCNFYVIPFSICKKCSVISVSEFKLVNSIIENMSKLQDTKHPIKETKAAIERKAPKETKVPKQQFPHLFPTTKWSKRITSQLPLN